MSTEKPRVLLVDLSGTFHRIYAMSAGESIDAAAEKTLSSTRRLASQYEHVAICCDSGRSFRHDIAKQINAWDPEYKGYKGKRPPPDPVLIAQLGRVERDLYAEGFAIYKAPGFEADDIMATLCAQLRAAGYMVDVSTEDKDLRSLATDEPPQVRIIRKGGEVNGPAEIKERFGVPPNRLIELLALSGDTTDGVPGIKDLGVVRAAKIVNGFPSFAEAHAAAVDEAADVISEEALRAAQKAAGQKMDKLLPRKFQPATRAAIAGGKQACGVSLQLVTLRTDVPVDCALALAPRVVPDAVQKAAERRELAERANAEAEEEEAAIAAAQAEFEQQERDQEEAMTMQAVIPDADFTDGKPPSDRPTDANAPTTAPLPQPAAAPPVTAAKSQAAVAPTQNGSAPKPAGPQTAALARVTQERPFEKQLEPRNPAEGQWLAETIFASKLFKDIGDVDKAYVKLAVGRSMGLTLYQSLSLHMFQGKIVKPALMIVAQVRLNPQCEYIHKVFGDDKKAVWATKRKGNPRVAEWEFTIEEAEAAGLVKADSGWAKWRKNMLSWRAATFLSREEWAEVVGDFLTPEEAADMRAIDTTGETVS